MFYGVYYYVPGCGSATVYLVGFYDNLNLAKQTLAKIMPNYKPNYHNSVSGSGKIGWINEYTMNQSVLNLNISDSSQLACNQPHTSVDLFNNNNRDNDISLD